MEKLYKSGSNIKIVQSYFKMKQILHFHDYKIWMLNLVESRCLIHLNGHEYSHFYNQMTKCHKVHCFVSLPAAMGFKEQII